MANCEFVVVAIGEPLIEFNCRENGDARTYLQGFGGDTSNMAIAAARLGARVAYVTRIGDDAFGRMFLDLWQEEGVDTRFVMTDVLAPTGAYFVTHAVNGHQFSYLRGGSAASRMERDTLPVEAFRAAAIVHVSGITQAISASSRGAAFAAMEAALQAGARVSYDPNLRLKLWSLDEARETVLASFALCDWALPSFEDARLLFGDDDAHALIDRCHRAGAPAVALKLGHDGCIVSDGQRVERIAGHGVDAVDATGAGDCFDGAFAVRRNAGDDAFAAARYANAAAALATTGYGAVAPLPRDRDVQTLLNRGAT